MTPRELFPFTNETVVCLPSSGVGPFMIALVLWDAGSSMADSWDWEIVIKTQKGLVSIAVGILFASAPGGHAPMFTCGCSQ